MRKRKIFLGLALTRILLYVFGQSPLIAQTFTEQTDITLPGVELGSVAWGDYDNDNDLDILLTGNSDSGYISKVYKTMAMAPLLKVAFRCQGSFIAL
jgi:hypothetical protein